MFESRYGRQVSQARSALVAAAESAARRVVDKVPDSLAGRGRESTGITGVTAVLRDLASIQRQLVEQVEAYPLAISVDTAGEPDQFGAASAQLVADLQYIAIRYHGLTTIPGCLQDEALRDIDRLVRSACDLASVTALLRLNEGPACHERQ